MLTITIQHPMALPEKSLPAPGASGRGGGSRAGPPGGKGAMDASSKPCWLMMASSFDIVFSMKYGDLFVDRTNEWWLLGDCS